MIDELNHPDYAGAGSAVYAVYRDATGNYYVNSGGQATPGTFEGFNNVHWAQYAIASTESPLAQFEVERPAAVDAVLNWSVTWYYRAGLALLPTDDVIGLGGGNESAGVSAQPSSSSYLAVADGDALANAMIGLASYKAATADDRSNALVMATERIDAAMRYQGSKYDPSQTLEFPRLAYRNQPLAAGVSPWPFNELTAAGLTEGASVSDDVWDWDADSNSAVVPSRVQRACLFEADSLISGSRNARLDAAHDGLASQSVGGMSESYAQVDASGRPVLCRQADELMRFYRLRSGSIR
jgi:hypothetical protein